MLLRDAYSKHICSNVKVIIIEFRPILYTNRAAQNTMAYWPNSKIEEATTLHYLSLCRFIFSLKINQFFTRSVIAILVRITVYSYIRY
jgi:hypothetical protein